jgi:hypothetical protein
MGVAGWLRVVVDFGIRFGICMARLFDCPVTDSVSQVAGSFGVGEASAGQAERGGADTGQAGREALGKNTRSSAVLRTLVDEKTGEIQRFSFNERRREFESEFDHAEARHGRYMLQRVARDLLGGRRTPWGGQWRVCGCFRRGVEVSGVAVLCATDTGRAHFGNVLICGSVWVCPVCSAKISERRKAEIMAACELHRVGGGGLYMVTMTWAHTRHDDVGQLVKRSRSALVKLREHWAYKEMRCDLDYVGMIRAFEVTHGDCNGWHPHFHELWLLNRPLTERQLRAWKSSLYEQWHAQCKRAGLGLPNRQAGIDIRLAECGGGYVAKFGAGHAWDVGSELTKGHTKQGRGSRTPWDLLRLVGEGQSRFGPLFVQYADAFFGSRQVFWTPGLKKVMGIDEVSDEELAEREDSPAQLVCMVSPEDWRRVLDQPYEARSMVLSVAESGGRPAVEAFLAGLMKTKGIDGAAGPQLPLFE